MKKILLFLLICFTFVFLSCGSSKDKIINGSQTPIYIYEGKYGVNVIYRIEGSYVYEGKYGVNVIYRIEGSYIYEGKYGVNIICRIEGDCIYEGKYGVNVVYTIVR